MVVIAKKVSVFNQDPDEMNDDDDWVLGSYAQSREMYDKEFTTNFPRILPADLICIGIKSDPIPLKDVNDNFLYEFDGRYLGESDLIKTRKEDKFKFTVEGRKRKASRWMVLKVNDELRSKEFDDDMSFHENHGYSQHKN